MHKKWGKLCHNPQLSTRLYNHHIPPSFALDTTSILKEIEITDRTTKEKAATSATFPNFHFSIFTFQLSLSSS